MNGSNNFELGIKKVNQFDLTLNKTLDSMKGMLNNVNDHPSKDEGKKLVDGIVLLA